VSEKQKYNIEHLRIKKGYERQLYKFIDQVNKTEFRKLLLIPTIVIIVALIGLLLIL